LEREDGWSSKKADDPQAEKGDGETEKRVS
jgi:hypothetical protein